MTRLPEEVEAVRSLAATGLNHSEIARATGIPRTTVRGWLRPAPPADRRPSCPGCGHAPHAFADLPAVEYAYLLGIYLGDGTIAKAARDVWTLRIVQDDRYPGIVREIVHAVRTVMPANRVHVTEKPRGWNCVLISSYSKAWPCLIPQHGPGRKHERRIELVDWQWAIVRRQPGMFLRGLIHSDGCRVQNRVQHGRYGYPRYFFSNVSADIQQLFRDACDLLGIEHRNNRWNSISVARRASVAKLDELVGPKR